jgi:hypothetical protein
MPMPMKANAPSNVPTATLIKYKTRRWSPSTLKEHRRIVDRCFASLRDRDVTKIGTKTLDDFYAELTARGGPRRHRPCPRRAPTRRR